MNEMTKGMRKTTPIIATSPAMINTNEVQPNSFRTERRISPKEPVQLASSALVHQQESIFASPFSSDLSIKLVGDVAVACSITFGIAPILSVIDKAIVQKAAGTHSIVQSSLESVVNIARNPVGFIKSPVFLLMWGVYAATYTTGKFYNILEFFRPIVLYALFQNRISCHFIFLIEHYIIICSKLSKDHRRTQGTKSNCIE